MRDGEDDAGEDADGAGESPEHGARTGAVPLGVAEAGSEKPDDDEAPEAPGAVAYVHAGGVKKCQGHAHGGTLKAEEDGAAEDPWSAGMAAPGVWCCQWYEQERVERDEAGNEAEEDGITISPVMEQDI